MAGVVVTIIKSSVGNFRPVLLNCCRSASTQIKPLKSVRNYASTVPARPDYTFRQLLDYRTFTYTYILGDNASKKAVIIDPVLEMVERDVQLCSQLGLDLVFALNTHMHADHITGSGEIGKIFKNCKSVIAKFTPAKAGLYVDDGDIIEFGKFSLECRSTPGHTDGCMTFVWHDKGMVFTGDAIFVRGCGRTDFQQGSPEKLYKSCHEKILSLPDHFLLYPGHDYSGHTVTTVEEEKKFNPRLTKSIEGFKQTMESLNLPPPKYIDVAIPGNLVDGLLEKDSASATVTS
jgi:sulfur dioxygenase